MLPINHEEARLFASMNEKDSNLARCYLELVELVKDDLPLAIAALENALEDLTPDHFLRHDIEKSISSLEDISGKVISRDRLQHLTPGDRLMPD